MQFLDCEQLDVMMRLLMFCWVPKGQEAEKVLAVCQDNVSFCRLFGIHALTCPDMCCIKIRFLLCILMDNIQEQQSANISMLNLEYGQS